MSLVLPRRLPWSNSRQAWAERGAGLLLLGAAGLLLVLGGGLRPATRVACWGLLVLAFAALLRRGWVRLFGPVLFYDLVRTARRSRHAAARMLYGGFLLGTLLAVFLLGVTYHHVGLTELFSAKASLPPGESAQFAEGFFYFFMFAQMVTVLILTPAYVAGGIAEEKDRQTLDVLFSTDLRGREIIAGMVLARLGNLVLVLLTGLPVLSILQFLGGVDPDLVLLSYGFLGLTILGLTGLSVVNSLYARKTRQAVVRTYLWALGYLVLSGLSWLLLHPSLGLATFPSTEEWKSPVTLEDFVGWGSAGNPAAVAVLTLFDVRRGSRLDTLLPDALAQYAWFHGLLALGCCTWSALRLRAVVLADAISDTDAAGRRRAASGHKGIALLRPPAVGARPMMWKELWIDAGTHRGLIGWLLGGVVLAAVFWPAVQLMYFYGTVWPAGPEARLTDLLSLWVRGVGMVLGCLMLLQVAVHAAGGISGERDKQTLDGLLATPLTNRQLLFAKWLGAVLSPRGMGLVLALVAAGGTLMGALHPLAAPCYLAVWFVLAGMLASLGLCFSVAYRTAHRAAFWTLFAVLGLTFMQLLASWDLADMWTTSFEATSVVPPFTLYVMAFSPREVQALAARELEESFRLVPWAMLFWAGWAYALWRFAGWRFRKEFGRAQQADVAGTQHAVPSAEYTVPSPQVMTNLPDSVLGAPPSSPAPPRPRSLWPRRLMQLAFVLLPLGLLALRFVQLHRATEHALQATLEETDRLDPGWRLDDLLAARKVVPDERNSAGVALEIQRKMPPEWPERNFYKQVEGLVPERQLSPKQHWLLWTEMARVHRLAAQARKLADMPEGSMPPVVYDTNNLFPLLHATQEMRVVANLLAHDTLLLAQEGDADGALADCRALLNINRAIGDEPFFQSMLVRSAVRAITVDRIERTLAQGEPSDAALLALQRLIEDEAQQPLLLIGLRGERAAADRIAQRVQDGTVNVDEIIYGIKRKKNLAALLHAEEAAMLLSGSFRGQRTALLRHYNEMIEAAKLPEEKQDAELGRINQAFLASLTRTSLTGLFAPAVLHWNRSLRRGDAQLRAAAVALALERFRRRHGRWPDSLRALTPEFLDKVPADPFDGKPLRYRVSNSGVVVYSIGENGLDDGGLFSRDQPHRSPDVGFQLWNPEQRRQPPAPPKNKED